MTVRYKRTNAAVGVIVGDEAVAVLIDGVAVVVAASEVAVALVVGAATANVLRTLAVGGAAGLVKGAAWLGTRGYTTTTR